MSSLLEVVLWTAIASLALLPAVYAVVLNVLKPLIAARQAREASLTTRHALVAMEPREGMTDRQALSALDARIKTYDADLQDLRSKGKHMSFRRALITPGVLWLVAVFLSGAGRIAASDAQALMQSGTSSSPIVALGWLTFAVSCACLLLGYGQVAATLSATRDAIEDSLPRLDMAASQPYESTASANGTQPWTLQIDMEVSNTSTTVARNSQIEIICQNAEDLYFPVLKPKRMTRDGQSITSGFTPSFHIKGMDSYLQYLLIRPNRPGTYRLTFVPRSDDLIGDPQTLEFTVNSIPSHSASAAQP